MQTYIALEHVDYESQDYQVSMRAKAFWIYPKTLLTIMCPPVLTKFQRMPKMMHWASKITN